ncbi:MAG: hypothetical protein PWR13_1354 [Archaeoglobi archaeon]|nr:hypothetical protein [Archaeoglobi archaeon]
MEKAEEIFKKAVLYLLLVILNSRSKVYLQSQCNIHSSSGKIDVEINFWQIFPLLEFLRDMCKGSRAENPEIV